MHILYWFAANGFSALAFSVLAGFFALDALSTDLPDYRLLREYAPSVTTRLHAGDGRLMAEYATENRVFVPIEAIPDHVAQAFVSAEDQRFHQHNGVDPIGIARAIVTNVQQFGTGRRPVGASTITQQVAKNFLLSNEVSVERKIREGLVALRMERTLSKQRILELYLNQIYLGRGAYGVAAAALAYFNKPLADLTIEEAAYLAALPKAPNNYHPTLRRDAAIARRNYVIDRMEIDGAIDATIAERARQADLVTFDRPDEETVTASYFAEEVRRQLQRIYGDADLYQGGLQVRTTVDPEMQTIADRALRDGLTAYDRRHGWRGPLTRFEAFDNWPDRLAETALPAGAQGWRIGLVLEVTRERALLGFADRSRGVIPFAEMQWARPWRENQEVGPEPQAATDVLALGDVVLASALFDPRAALSVADDPEGLSRPYRLEQLPEVQGAVVALDPHTGRVLAISGGYSFTMSEFNRATQARRQPGSSFKPFVYMTALDRGLPPNHIVMDIPIAIDQGEELGMWAPQNYSGDTLGPTPMRIGIERSKNLMTIGLLREIGLEPVRDTAVAFGVYDRMDLVYAMALGAGETTPLDLTAAYAVIVNGGRRIEPTFIDRIQDRDGNTLYRHDTRACDGCQDVEWAGQDVPPIPDPREQIADPVVAYQMVSMLEGVIQRGTGVRLQRLGLPLAGKTGTTNDARDAWFVGFSPDLVVGVYVGFDTPSPLGDREGGSRTALPIFGDVMDAALADQEVPPFRIPPGISLVRIDPMTGMLASAETQGAILEAFRPGTEPGRATIQAVDAFRPPETVTDGAVSSGTGGLY